MWRRDRRSGSATRSMATTFPPATVKPNTTRGRPPRAHTAPTTPSTSASLAARALPENVAATECAPRTSRSAPARTAAPSARSTTSGPSSSTREATSPPARELSRRSGRAAHDGGDLLEGDGEQVVQHEGQALRRAEGVENHEERKTHRVREDGLVLGAGAGPSPDARLERAVAQRVLPPGRPGAQHVQADARGDRGQPPCEVVHLTGV